MRFSTLLSLEFYPLFTPQSLWAYEQEMGFLPRLLFGYLLEVAR